MVGRGDGPPRTTRTGTRTAAARSAWSPTSPGTSRWETDPPTARAANCQRPHHSRPRASVSLSLRAPPPCHFKAADDTAKFRNFLKNTQNSAQVGLSKGREVAMRGAFHSSTRHAGTLPFSILSCDSTTQALSLSRHFRLTPPRRHSPLRSPPLPPRTHSPSPGSRHSLPRRALTRRTQAPAQVRDSDSARLPTAPDLSHALP